jgi:hypothetical protein
MTDVKTRLSVLAGQWESAALAPEATKLMHEAASELDRLERILDNHGLINVRTAGAGVDEMREAREALKPGASGALGRFSPHRSGDWGIIMRWSPIGDWCRYNDARRHIERLEAELAQATGANRV